MKSDDSTREKDLRVNFKQTSKNHWYCEFSVKADTIEELKAKSQQLRDYAVAQVNKLNGG